MPFPSVTLTEIEPDVSGGLAVAGFVRDPIDGTPLGGTVITWDANWGWRPGVPLVQSDSMGHFRLAGMEEAVALSASRVFFSTLNVPVEQLRVGAHYGDENWEHTEYTETF